jgi:hypothetical protein
MFATTKIDLVTGGSQDHGKDMATNGAPKNPDFTNWKAKKLGAKGMGQTLMLVGCIDAFFTNLI